MNIIEATASFFDSTIHYATQSLQVFLNGNYYLIAFLLNICNSVYEFIIETVTFSSAVLLCYYRDFIGFLNELAFGINFIYSAVFQLFANIVLNFYSGLCYINNAIISLYVKLIYAVHVINLYFSIFIETCVYFIKLLFDSVILILQLGPNFILLIFQICSVFILFVVNFSNNILSSLASSCVMFITKCQNFVVDIPLKAYIGLILIICIYYQRLTMYKYLKITVVYIFLLAVSLLLILKNILKNIFGVVQIIGRKLGIHDVRTRGLSNYRCSIIFRILKMFIYVFKVPFQKTNKFDDEISAEKERLMCVVCHDKEKNTLLIPCRHLCMCEDCTNTIQDAYLGCPLCRRQILDTVRVYT